MRSFMRFAAVATLFVAFTPSIVFPQDKFFDADGVKIRYVEQGSGEPIVLLHGGGAANSLDDWIKYGILQNLAKDYRVIAFDARGYGKSSRPREVAAYGREATLDVVRLLDHLGIKRAHIIGFSGGANTTSQLLTMHPERFVTATLIAQSGFLAWSPASQKRADQDASEMEKECISRSRIYRLAATDAPKPSEEEFQRRIAECMADPTIDRFATAARTRAQGGQAITPEQASAVTVPTRGIVGSLDSFLLNLQRLQKLRPTIELIVVDGATHGGDRGILTRPEVVSAIRDFLAGNPGSASK